MKILKIRFSSIGDIVITSPVIRCTRKKYPEAEIHFLTKKQFSALVQPNPHLDKILILEKNLIQTIEQLQAENYNLVIDLHKNLRTVRIKQALKTKWYSYNKLNVHKWLFVNFKINLLPNKHLVDRYFDDLKKVGIPNDEQGLEFHFPTDFKFDLESLNLAPNNYIALSIGGTYATKRIPNNRLQMLIKRLKLPVLLLGHGEDDEANAELILKNNTHKVVNGVGKFNLYESAYLIKHAKLVVTGDTGLMHIAAAFQKNIEAIWGNTHASFGMFAYVQSRNGSIVNNHQVHLNCRPCSKLGSKTCPRNHFNCMQLQDWETIVNNCNSID